MHTHSHPTPPPLLLLLLVPTVIAPRVAPPPAAPPRCPATLSFVSAAFLSGSAMELPCRCKPEEALRGVTWFYYRELPGWFSSRPVVLSDRSGSRVLDRDAMSADLTSRFSILLFNLVVLETRPSDSGHYICGSSDGDFYFAYEVVVQFTGSARLVLLDRGEQPRAELTVKGVHNKVTVFTAWSGWTPCDRCGRPGEMINAGVCMVSGSVITSAKQGAPRYVSEVLGGPVGCGSLATPRFALLAARSRPPEILVRSCRDTCASTGSAVQDVHAALRELMGPGTRGGCEAPESRDPGETRGALVPRGLPTERRGLGPGRAASTPLRVLEDTGSRARGHRVRPGHIGQQQPPAHLERQAARRRPLHLLARRADGGRAGGDGEPKESVTAAAGPPRPRGEGGAGHPVAPVRSSWRRHGGGAGAARAGGRRPHRLEGFAGAAAAWKEGGVARGRGLNTWNEGLKQLGPGLNSWERA
uniref:Uncharacterized protein LOC116944494 n=1 Tax=Petromyzon marinus TaxID=7757 RepID=A0AAJ7WXT8_PETMA|nr:uncharacterized protein LOC116944494 [Petromyzon marinus]